MKIHTVICNCAGSSGVVHSVFLIDVYLDLENPGGSGFRVGVNRRVIGGNTEDQFTSIREQRWTDPDTEGGLQVSRQGEQGEQGERGEQGEQESKGNKGNKGQILYISPNLISCIYAMNERYQLCVYNNNNRNECC